MELVELENLEVGDEIVISCQSHFKYLKVLVKPSLGKKTHWNTGKLLYKSVKCSTRRDSVIKSYVRNGQTYTYTNNTWAFTPEDHNHTQYIDLEYKQLLLVNRD